MSRAWIFPGSKTISSNIQFGIILVTSGVAVGTQNSFTYIENRENREPFWCWDVIIPGVVQLIPWLLMPWLLDRQDISSNGFDYG